MTKASRPGSERHSRRGRRRRKQYQWQLPKKGVTKRRRCRGVTRQFASMWRSRGRSVIRLAVGSRCRLWFTKTERQVSLIICRHYPLRLSVSFTKNMALITGRRKYARQVRQMWAICTLVVSDRDCPGRQIKKKKYMAFCNKHRQRQKWFSDSELQGPDGGRTEAPSFQISPSVSVEVFRKAPDFERQYEKKLSLYHHHYYYYCCYHRF